MLIGWIDAWRGRFVLPCSHYGDDNSDTQSAAEFTRLYRSKTAPTRAVERKLFRKSYRQANWTRYSLYLANDKLKQAWKKAKNAKVRALLKVKPHDLDSKANFCWYQLTLIKSDIWNSSIAHGSMIYDLWTAHSSARKSVNCWKRFICRKVKLSYTVSHIWPVIESAPGALMWEMTIRYDQMTSHASWWDRRHWYYGDQVNPLGL